VCISSRFMVSSPYPIAPSLQTGVQQNHTCTVHPELGAMDSLFLVSKFLSSPRSFTG
jgi:hypothetical protein